MQMGGSRTALGWLLAWSWLLALSGCGGDDEEPADGGMAGDGGAGSGGGDSGMADSGTPDTGMADASMPVVFGTSDDIAKAQGLWKTMTDEQFATNWMPYPGKGDPMTGRPKREPDTVVAHPDPVTFVRIFLNDAAYANTEDFGDGSIIVKQNFTSDTDADLDSITVMQRIQGYDPDTNDWFWAKFMPDGMLAENPAGVKLAGRIGKGGSAGCIPCHTRTDKSEGSVNQDDFVVINNEPLPFGTAKNIEDAKQIWSDELKIAANAQPGDGADYTASWKHLPGTPGFVDGATPHGKRVRIFVNSVAETDIRSFQGHDDIKRNGAIVVKENLGPDGKGTLADGSNKLAAVTVMKKVSGFNPAGGDWFWAKYDHLGNVLRTPTGYRMAGKVAGCLGCHTGDAMTGGGADRVFRNDNPAGSTWDRARAVKLWADHLARPAAGADPVYRGWTADARGWFLTAQGNGHPHQGLVRIFLNHAQPGQATILVKEEADANMTVTGITVMQKLPGYNFKAADWFWAKFTPAADGTPAKSGMGVELVGRPGGCLGCHAAAAGGDFTFVNDVMP